MRIQYAGKPRLTPETGFELLKNRLLVVKNRLFDVKKPVIGCFKPGYLMLKNRLLEV